MNQEGARRFLIALGIDGDRIEVPEGRGWVNAPCPMAFHRHGGGEDAHPSFGIAINEEGPSVYYCFGCTQDAQHVGRLLHNMWLMTGSYPWEAAEVYAREEVHRKIVKPKKPPDPWVGYVPRRSSPLPPEVLKKYPLLQNAKGFEARRCREWLADERGIPPWVQNLCRLRYAEQEQWVVFPLTDIHGRVYLMRARSRKKKWIRTVSPKVAGFEDLEFPSLKRDVGAWFNMFLVDWSSPVWLVEGELDAMKLMALGEMNAVASATSQVTDLQLQSLAASTLILGYDDDVAGRAAHSRIADRLSEKAVLFVARWSVVKVKDAGDLTSKEQLLEVRQQQLPYDPLA